MIYGPLNCTEMSLCCQFLFLGLIQEDRIEELGVPKTFPEFMLACVSVPITAVSGTKLSFIYNSMPQFGSFDMKRSQSGRERSGKQQFVHAVIIGKHMYCD